MKKKNRSKKAENVSSIINIQAKGYKIPKNHFTTNSSCYVQQVSTDLFEKFGINGFRYIRLYHEGSRFEFTTDPLWFEHFMQQGYFNYSPLDRQSNFYKAGYFLWDACSKVASGYESIIRDAIENFGGGRGFSIIRPAQIWIDKFDFSAPLKNQMINEIFLTNFDYFDRFVDYFLEKMCTLIDKAHKAREFLPYIIEPMRENADSFLPQRILSAINFQSGQTSDGLRSVLTKRELECLYWLDKGKTIPEIALIFNISHRTVEKFIVNLKEKFGCRTLFQIGQIMNHLRLDRLLQGFRF